MDTKLDLNEIVLIGRVFSEYFTMFHLEELDLKKHKILDVASGISSFGAEGREKGLDITASDRIYQYAAGEIERKCAGDLKLILDKVAQIREMYRWDYFSSIQELKEHRESAYRLFLVDYENAPEERYIYTQYPRTGFEDKAFTLSLVSHFLFLYDEQLDFEFHSQTIAELLRITSGEIRIFPLINLRGQRSPFVDRLKEEPMLRECRVREEKVNYEFMKNGDTMLRIISAF